MKYNAKYNRWFTKEGLVYRYNENTDKLELVKPQKLKSGYNRSFAKGYGHFMVYRAVYETFVGEIPKRMEIDHINTVRDDDRLINLRCVTHRENLNNKLTLRKRHEVMKGRNLTEFGKKYKEHFGLTKCDDEEKWQKEYTYYYNHKVCKWEVEDAAN